jgi:hypothetical protein
MANGSKRPSGCGAHTISLRAVSTTSITTGTGGDAYCLFVPGPSDDSLEISAPTTTLFPATTGLTTSIVTFPSFAARGRVVSAGIKWHDIAARTETGGVVIPMLVDEPTTLLDGNTHTLAELMTSYNGTVTDRRQPGYAILQPINNAQVDEFRVLASTFTNDDGENPWPGLLLYVNGADSSTVLQVTVVVHYEVTVDIQGYPGTPSPRNEFLQSAVSTMPSKIKDGKPENKKDRVFNDIWSSLVDAGRGLGADLADKFGFDNIRDKLMGQRTIENHVPYNYPAITVD